MAMTRETYAATVLFLCLVTAATAGDRPKDRHRVSDSPDEASQKREIIYYDHLDQGRLAGGRLEVGPNDAVYKHLHGSGQPTEPSAAPPWAVHALAGDGPPANRVDLVILGDGYTEDELEVYAGRVDRILKDFFNEEPLGSYAPYFNVYRVDVISNESGVDEPALNIFRDTALDMTYDCGGVPHLLCVNLAKAAEAASLAPDADQIMVLANSNRYGGAGYSAADVITAGAGNSAASNVILHEFGHAFASLADEYFPSSSGVYQGPEVAEANATIHSAATLADSGVKWAAWLEHPEVDTFKGCRHMHKGINRPTFNSKMRSLAQPFGPVNVEQFVLRLYSYVDPIEGRDPDVDVLDCTALFPRWLSITTPQPGDHDLQIQWLINGDPLPGFDAPALPLRELGLSPGVYIVEARVVDTTLQVRNETEREALMTDATGWVVEICPGITCAPGEAGCGQSTTEASVTRP